MSGATAGPWRVGDAGATVFGPPTGDPLKMSRVVARTNVGPLAAVESMANARLIAAAPAMRDALKACVLAFEALKLTAWEATTEGSASLYAFAKAQEAVARAALAAAEGAGQ